METASATKTTYFIECDGSQLKVLAIACGEHEYIEYIKRPNKQPFQYHGLLMDYNILRNAEGEVGGFHYYSYDDEIDEMILNTFKDCQGFESVDGKEFNFYLTDKAAQQFELTMILTSQWTNEANEILLEIPYYHETLNYPFAFPVRYLQQHEYTLSKSAS